MPRRTRHRAEAHADILEAAVELIATRGCAGATVARIADRAGLSAAAIFWHFTDKSGLLRAVGELVKERWVQRVKAAARGPTTGRARLARVMTHHLHWVATDDPHLRAFVVLALEAEGLGEPEAAAYVRELGALYQAFLAQLIRAGQQDGSLGSGVPAEAAARILASALLGAILQQAITGEAGAAVDLAGAVLDGVLGVDQQEHAP